MSDRYKIDLEGSESSVSVTMILTETEAETISTVATALDNERRTGRDEYAPRMTLTSMPRSDYRTMIDELRKERDAIWPKTASNPVYNAHCRAIASLQAIMSAAYVEDYRDPDA